MESTLKGLPAGSDPRACCLFVTIFCKLRAKKPEESALGGLVGTFTYFVYYVFECLACMYVCVPCTCLAPEDARRGHDPLELELQL